MEMITNRCNCLDCSLKGLFCTRSTVVKFPGLDTEILVAMFSFSLVKGSSGVLPGRRCILRGERDVGQVAVF